MGVGVATSTDLAEVMAHTGQAGRGDGPDHMLGSTSPLKKGEGFWWSHSANSFRYGITSSPDRASSDRAAWCVTHKPLNKNNNN